jgi:hypothetical protein
MNNIEVIIEHLQEMGKVVAEGITQDTIIKLNELGYPTKFVSSDRDYLVLDK